jgi:hypothetical protein
MLGPAGCRPPMTLASSSWSKSARRMRTRLPMCSAGSDPWSIHYLTFCWFSLQDRGDLGDGYEVVVPWHRSTQPRGES